jgi:hypothetical protein
MTALVSITLIGIGILSTIVLVGVFLTRIGAPRFDLMWPSLACAVMSCFGIWLSHRAGSADASRLLFMVGISAVIALAGLLYSLRRVR